MIYIIIGVIIGLYIAITGGWMDVWSDICTNIIVTIILPLGCGLFGLLAWLLLGSIIGCFMPTIDIKETKELYALRDNNQINGSFFLGSGRIDEEMHYVYIVKEDKGKQMQTLEIDANEIYLNDNVDTPTLDIYSKDFKYGWMYWFAMPETDCEYVFNIPSGSIDYEYNIDLE